MLTILFVLLDDVENDDFYLSSYSCHSFADAISMFPLATPYKQAHSIYVESEQSEKKLQKAQSAIHLIFYRFVHFFRVKRNTLQFRLVRK